MRHNASGERRVFEHPPPRTCGCRPSHAALSLLCLQCTHVLRVLLGAGAFGLQARRPALPAQRRSEGTGMSSARAAVDAKPDESVFFVE